MSNEFRIKKGLIVNETDLYVSGAKAGFGTITPSAPLEVYGSGSTVFTVNGASGQLFGVSDDLTDSLFSVNTIAGLPVIEAFADNTVNIGTYGNEELIVSSSQVFITSASLSGPTLFLDGNVGIGTSSPSAKLHVSGTIADNRLFQVGDNYLVITGSNGYVGIGTTSPDAPLHIEGAKTTDAPLLKLVSTATGDGDAVIHLVANQDGESGIIYRNPSNTNSQGWFVGSGDAFDEQFYVYDRDNYNAWLVVGHDGKVGIGTTSPSAKLHVSGTIADNRLFQVGDNYLVVTGSNGNIGIGTTGPTEKLEVTGNAILDASNANLKIKAGVTGTKGDIQWTFDTDSTVYASAGIEYDNRGTDGFLIDSGYPITMDFNASYIRWRYQGSEKMRLNTSGNLGIGTTSPTVPLQVEGAISASGALEIGGDLTLNSSDITFDNGYGLESTSGATLKTGVGGGTWQAQAGSAAASAFVARNSSGTAILDIDGNDTNYGVIIANDLTVGGIITAQEFHTEFVSASIIYQSGSTKFGDTSDDVHSFSGSIRVTGSGDHYFTHGNVGIGTTSPTHTLDVLGNNTVAIFRNTDDSGADTGIAIRGARNGTVDGVTTYIDFLNNDNNSGGEHYLGRIYGSMASTGGNDGTLTLQTYNGSSFVTGLNIDENGNIGIKTTTPSSTLHVNGPDTNDHTPTVYLKNNGANAGEGDVLDVETARGDGASDSYIARFRNSASTKLYIQGDGNIGIGTESPSTKLEVNGGSKFNELVTVVGDIYPETNYVSNIGAINKKFLTLNVAELIVETLVASERRSTVGGRFNVGISTQLSQSLASGSTTIIVENNNLNNGDIIHLEGGVTPKVEFMKVTSSYTDIPGDGYSYEVERNLDGTGANDWDAGSGVFNTGQIGNGFIDQYAINSLTSGSGVNTAGPTIAFMERTGSLYPDIDIRAGVGNLKGWYGYTTESFGFAAGNYKAQNITVDPTNGLRIRDIDEIQLQAQAGSLTIGDSFLYNSDTGVLFVSGSNIDLVSPSFFLGNSSQFISGSGGNLQIESTNFTVATNGDVSLTGTITAEAGNIGGFAITSDAITGSGFYLSGSATGTDFFISSSNFNVKANGDVTGSSVLFDGGKISGSNVEIDVNTLNLNAGSGAIVIDSTNEIITVGNGAIRLDNSFGTEAAGLEAISSSVIRVSADGTGGGISNYMTMFHSDTTNWGMEVYGDGNTIFFAGEDAGTIKGILAGFDFYGDRIVDNATADTLVLRSNGDITGSQVLFTGGKISGSAIEFDVTNFTAKGNTVEISGSSFHLLNGNITASNVDLSGNINAETGTIAGFTISGDTIVGSAYTIDASADGNNEYFISSSEVKIEGNGDAVFGEYIFSKFNDENDLNGLTRNSDSTNIKILEGRDANGHGALLAINADGDFYIAPISSSVLSGSGWNGFDRELRYDLANDRWEIRQNTYIDADLDVTGTISGASFDSSGNVTIGGNLTVVGNTIITGSVTGHPVITPVASDSNNSNGVVVQDLTFDEFGHTNTIGTVDLDNRYLQLSGGTLTGNVSSNSQIISTKGTIAFANLANAAFLAGTTSNGIGIDSNEIRSKGTDLYIGTIDANKIDFGTGGVLSRVVIASGGNVGIGNDSPSAKLHISGSNDVLLVEGSGSTLFDIQGSQGQLFSVTDDLTGTLFSVNDISGIPILSVDSDDTVTMGTFGENTLVVTGSLVGIGTASPSQKLHIVGGQVRLDSNTGGFYQYNTSGGFRSAFYDNGTVTSIYGDGDGSNPAITINSGNVGIGTTSPSRPLTIEGSVSASGDVQIGSGTGANAYGRLQVNQSSNTDEEGIGILSSGAGRSMRIWVDETNSYISSGDGGNGVLVLNEGTGNVGIGTTSPGNKLHVYRNATQGYPGSHTPSNATLQIQDNSNSLYLDGNSIIGTGAGTLHVGNASNTAMNLWTNGVNRLHIEAGGNIGIGTDSPAVQLHISGSNSTFAQVRVEAGADGYDSSVAYSQASTIKGISGYDDSTDTVAIKYGTFGGNGIDIDSSGNVGIGETSPLAKLHVKNTDTGGTVTALGAAIVEDADAQLDLLSTSDATWGSAINLVEAAGGGANTDVWSIVRQTTGGTGDSSLRFNFGTVNNHINTNRVLFSSTGDVTIANDLTVGGIVTAQEFHTEFVSASIIYQSGSTKFGDTLDDVHAFTGSVDILTNTSGGNRSFIISGGKGPRLQRRGDSAGWAYEYGFNANDDTDLGGFGALGTGDSGFTYYYIGAAYNDNSMVVLDTGEVGIGTTSPSANLDIVGGGGNTSPTLELNSSTSTTFNHAINAFNSNLTSGENQVIVVGKEGSTKNSGYIGYKWNGAGSDSNLITFGHWGSDNLMNLTADGKLGIGTTSPDEKLHVVGNSLVTGDGYFGTPNANEDSTSNIILSQAVGGSGTHDFITIADTTNDGGETSRIVFKNRYGTGDFTNGQESSFIASERQSTSGIYDLVFGTAGHQAEDATERMRIDHLGNVGIGTDSPNASYKTHIEAGSGNNTGLLVTTTDNADVAQVILAHDGGLQGGLQLISDKTNGIAKIRVTNSSFHPLAFEVRGADGTNERMRINGSGNVGIGTISPEAHLHIRGDGDEILRLADTSDTGNPYLSFYQNATRRSFIQHHDTDDNLKIASEYGSIQLLTGTSGSESPRLTIDSSGNVGIGTTNPAGKFNSYISAARQVAHNGNGGDLSIISDNNSTPVMYIKGTGTADLLNVFDNTTEVFTILDGGNVGIGTTSPSTTLDVNGTATVTALIETSTRELKKDITELEDQSSIVDSLQPVSYIWKESEEEDFGLIAEDVEEIAPHLVHRDQNGKPTGIKYSKLSVLLLDVVQKQSTLIEDLNERITKLENERGS